MRYFTSFGYINDGDVYKTTKTPEYDSSFNYQRYNWRFNMDYDLTKTTLVSVNVAGNLSYRNHPVYQDESTNDQNFFTPFFQTPTNLFPIKHDDGYWGDSSSGNHNLVANLTTTGQQTYKTFSGFYDFAVNQKLDFIVKGLSAKANLSYSSGSRSYSRLINNGGLGATNTTGPKAEIRFWREYDYSDPIVNPDGTVDYPMTTEKRHPDDYASEDIPIRGVFDQFVSYSRELYYDFSLNYGASFGNHNVTAMALFLRRMRENTLRGDNNTRLDFPYYEEDWVSRVTYNYKERYLFEANAAYTGSEKFAPGKRFGFFPSGSVGWRVTEEKWMKWKPLTNLKIRYSYGKSGNDRAVGDAPRFNYIPVYAAGDPKKDIQFGLDQSVSYGPMYSEANMANPNATWEDAVKQNLGFEIGFFDKLNLTIDLFDEKRTGILMQRNTLATWVGSPTLPAVNIGETKNHGFEADAVWRDKISKKFSYWLRFNIAASENRVVFRDDAIRMDEYLKNAGKPIGTQWKYHASGNFNSIDDIFNGPITNIPNSTQGELVPGDMFYIDYNGDGVINTNDQVPQKYINYPLTTYSFSLGFTWKNVEFNAMLYAVPRINKELIAGLTWDFPSSNMKAQPNTLDRWTPGTVAEGPVRPSVHLANNYNSRGSTFTYANHAYLRLKNLEVSYSVPKRFLTKANLSKCQIYASGNNLLTWTKGDSRRDPETSDQNVYPIVRRYNLGVRLSF
jgi:TonB-linked SusC/RagA family outer membrane protein